MSWHWWPLAELFGMLKSTNNDKMLGEEIGLFGMSTK